VTCAFLFAIIAHYVAMAVVPLKLIEPSIEIIIENFLFALRIVILQIE
jgi:hypothetical protein